MPPRTRGAGPGVNVTKEAASDGGGIPDGGPRTAPRAAGEATVPARTAVRRRAAAVRWYGLVLAALALALVCALSLAVGARSIPLATVWDVLTQGRGGEEAFVVRRLRVPRTVIGLLAGAALGLAGALMQGLTRNPLADPGLLGVNNGASAAVVVAIAFLGVGSPLGYVWFAFLGAALAYAVVYLLGSSGRSAGPDRMVLAGAAINATLIAFVSAVVLHDIRAFDEFRFWAVGSLAGRDMEVVRQVGPLILAGVVTALFLARPLNALALGEETGRALGAHTERTRLAGTVAVALLCGGATAAAGPIAFIGLAVPHLVRMVTGPDQRWVMAYSLLLAPVLLLGADVVGRFLAAPGELETGIVTAFLGAPLFIALSRRRRIAAL
ncbi:iron chelate uptake ABC transporter family permease subunit [Streptomyces sp. SID4919]|nr:iron chelate uptake ABC transporter family permease subunit [Streptomyces sp. SID4919]SCK07142.1 iron complex transport system permease protein [Streptomyces sp. AmelKG-E11A]